MARLLLSGASSERLTGKFDIDADAVRQQAEPRHQRRVRSGNGFCVDITAKAVLAPQQLQHADHLFHRVVRTAQHRTGEEQPFDVIAAVEPDGQIRQFARRKGGAGHIVGHTVHTIFAVVNAAVAQQHLQQADAPAVSRKGMAQPGGHSAAKAGLVARPLGAAGRTGHVIFCAVGQDGELVHQGLFHRKIPPRRVYLPLTPTAADRKRRGAEERLTTWPSSRPRGPRCAGGSGPHP